MILLIILLVVVGIFLVWFARRVVNSAGLADGQIVYMDTHGKGRVTKPLFSKRLGLSGKPDYLLLRKGVYIPVEVKSSPMPSNGAHQSHKLQLVAYCHLVEEHFGVRPTYGIIKYSDGTYNVEYCHDLEKELTDIVGSMRADIAAENVIRSHRYLNRCLACSFQIVCGDDLTR